MKSTISTLICLFFALSVGLSQESQRDSISSERLFVQEMEALIDSSSTYYNNGNHVKSLNTNMVILNKALEREDVKYIYKGYRFLGYDYITINDTIIAKEYFENCLKYAKLTKDDHALATSYMDLANLYNISNNRNIAFGYHDKSIALFKKVNDSTELSKAIYNAFISAFDDNDLDLVYKYLSDVSKPSFDKYHDPNFRNALGLYWSDYYQKTNQYQKAEIYARKVIDTAAAQSFNVQLADGYLTLSESLFSQKKYRQAYENLALYKETNEKNEILKLDAESKVIASKFQIKHYQREAADAKEKIQLQSQIASNKNRLSNVLIAVCIAGLLLFITLFRAYTKRKSLNKALELKNKEYLEAKQKSEHLSDVKTKFFSTVSHELRTPLYGVIGLSSILLEDVSLKSHEDDLKSLKFSADYLLALINDVLQINKIDANREVNDESTFAIRNLIQNIVSSFEYMRLQNKNKVVVSISNDIPAVIKGNAVRLSQVLMNLIGNAFKFTENGVITIKLSEISADEENVTIEFAVQDTGIGIAKDKQNRIFDEFTQAGSLDYTYQGTGLGLPIVKKLLTLSNSEIKLKSAIGKGSVFSFKLPFEISVDSEVKIEKTLVDTSVLKNKRILIADDNRINQIVTQKILEKHHIICTVAENGEEAVKLVQERSFDLVLMDLNMPVKDGIEATIDIKKFNKALPIIALTAVEVEEVRNKIYQAGMNDIIVKPYDAAQFIKTIIINLSHQKLEKRTVQEVV